jgi:hypothetical protein
MLCALRDLALEHDQPDLSAEKAEDFLLHKRRQGLNRFKVVPRLGDREALLAILESKNIGPWRDFQVAKCLHFFSKEFRKRSEQAPPETLRRLLRDITARMGLVMITVVGENPYEIFETLNSTGLPLEQSDLVRNYVFMAVPLHDQQAFYDDQWRPFECELLDRHRFRTQVEARLAVFDFIEGWYNPRRRHSALDYLSPMMFERTHSIGDRTEPVGSTINELLPSVASLAARDQIGEDAQGFVSRRISTRSRHTHG